MTGVWRSYKAFFFSGKVEMHTDVSYLEIAINDGGCLIHLHSTTRRKATVLPADRWKVVAMKSRWYIFFDNRQVYEIITLEFTDMVLYDLVKGQKIFFARMPEWNRRIQPVINSVRHINRNVQGKQTPGTPHQ